MSILASINQPGPASLGFLLDPPTLELLVGGWEGRCKHSVVGGLGLVLPFMHGPFIYGRDACRARRALWQLLCSHCTPPAHLCGVLPILDADRDPG